MHSTMELYPEKSGLSSLSRDKQTLTEDDLNFGSPHTHKPVSTVKVCDFHQKRWALRIKFLVTCVSWTWLKVLCFMCFCQVWFTAMNVWYNSHLCVTVMQRHKWRVPHSAEWNWVGRCILLMLSQCSFFPFMMKTGVTSHKYENTDLIKKKD
jgi:hypothetical protein